MSLDRRHFFGCVALLCAAAASVPERRRRRRFRIYDGLQSYIDRPDMAGFGIDCLHWADPPIWDDRSDRHRPPDIRRVRDFVASLPDDDAPFVLDIEQFPVSGADARNSVKQLLAVARAFRQSIGRRSLGFYAVLPQGDYWRAIAASGTPEHRAWQSENDMLRPVEFLVDALYPSLYAFYPDRQGWVAYATAQIEEARRISNKPVYPFLWPEYHSSARVGGFIDPDYWRLQLETVHDLADGMVLFGGWDERARLRRPWDDRAPWWRELKGFIRAHRLDK